MKIEIKSLAGSIIFEGNFSSLAAAIIEAVKNKSNLRDANLRDADLRDADLRGANLRGADLRDADLLGVNLRDADLLGADLLGADLRDADLRDADLRGANLRGANLRGANLRGADLLGADLLGADLFGADLFGANLRGADLRGANLRDANLRGANLRDANLRPTKYDFWAVLTASANEVPGLRAALVGGKVDGSTYNGECACLVGTIANVRQCAYNDLPALKPDSYRPAERFFLAIKAGDTPETNPASKLAVEWIDEWTDLLSRAFIRTTMPEILTKGGITS